MMELSWQAHSPDGAILHGQLPIAPDNRTCPVAQFPGIQVRNLFKSGHKKVSYERHSEGKSKSITKALYLNYFLALPAQYGANQ
jgi:hypothetical protein